MMKESAAFMLYTTIKFLKSCFIRDNFNALYCTRNIKQ